MKKLFTLILILSLLLSPLEAWAKDEVVLPQELQSIVQQSTLLLQLKQKLAQVQYRYTMLTSNVEEAKQNLIDIEEAIINLEMVIANLDAQIDDNDHQITSVKTQKERKKMDIAELEEDVQILELQLEDQKKVVGDLMTLIYVKRDVYYDESSVDPVKVLASPDSVSETLQNITYLDLVENEGQNQVDKLNALSSELTDKWTELRQRKAELDALDSQLSDEAQRLIVERENQQNILDETNEEKTMLETMLSSSDERKEDLLDEIKIYQKNVDDLELKLVDMTAGLTEDQKNLVSQIQSQMSLDFDSTQVNQVLALDWPVSVSKGISAFFHDDGYIGSFGVDHGAIDIRCNQGTAIHAPADGVVTAVVYDETSTKYAYIQIAHRMGVSTVYGHISAPAVAIGDYVLRDQVIGYSGAMPGTVGAGARTTGPHLHFEVWQDGVRVDPLKYLPLDQLDMSSLPEEYLNQVQGALEDQIRHITDQLGL